MAKVYIKTDEKNRVIAVNSDVFLPDPSGWVQVDEGDGEPYIHAQGNYLREKYEHDLRDENFVYRYKYENGKVAERTHEEMQEDIPETISAPPSNDELAQAMFNVYDSLNDGLKDIASRENPLRVTLPFPVKVNLIYEFDGRLYICVKTGIASQSTFGDYFVED